MNHQGAFLGAGASGAGGQSGVVRRAHPASGAQWNVQVVRGKVNGRCLWNACKALSLGLLLMVLGAAMATIGYYADHLSMAQEVRGNHTVKVRNESRGFHLNNLSYAGPIVMGVGGFIVVAACVMTFEARDSAAKVVPARFKAGGIAPTVLNPGVFPGGLPGALVGGIPAHRTAGSQTGASPRAPEASSAPRNRAALTQAFVQFSRGLTSLEAKRKSVGSVGPVVGMIRSPSAPDLIHKGSGSGSEQGSPNFGKRIPMKPSPRSRKTFAACALLNPGLLHRHALSVDETAPTYRLSNDSLHGSQDGSMAMDLHLPNDGPVTLRVRDRSRRRPLTRQRPVIVDEDAGPSQDNSRRNSNVPSPRTHGKVAGTHNWLPPPSGSRRSSNASDCTHRVRPRRRDCPHKRGRLERAISSDSRLTGSTARCQHHAAPLLTATNVSPGASTAGEESPHQHSST